MKNTTRALDAQPVKIGIIIGAGSGRRLADIFKEFLSKLAQKHGVQVEFLEDPLPGGKLYHSHLSLEKETSGELVKSQKISLEEVVRLEKTVNYWYKEGVRGIFRTSINAETLYLFRQRVKAAKEFSISRTGKRILFIRDQAEGFYANTDYSIEDHTNEIHFKGKFTKSHQQQVIAYALQRAKSVFKNQHFEKLAIYKHHLFGNALQNWVAEIDLDIKLYQPDTGFTELFDFLGSKRGGKNLLVICSNEVGDIIYESIVEPINAKAKLMLFSQNIYLSPNFNIDLSDYQTAHGSADDRTDSEDLLPYATFRICAEMAERFLNIRGIKRGVKSAIFSCKNSNLATTTSIKKKIFSFFKLESDG